MATFRVKLHDTTLPLTVDTDLTGASVKAFIRSARAEGEVPAVVPVNVTDPVVGAFDLVLAEVGSGEFDLEVLVEKGGEQVRTPSVGFDRLVIGPNLDDPLAAPYVPSATLEQVIEEKFAGQADRLIPFAETAQEAAADAGVFAAATEFDANRAGESAFQAGQSAGYALGHRNAAKASADAAVAAAASIAKDVPGGVPGLDGDARVPDARMPERLSPQALNSTIGAAVPPVVAATIADAPEIITAAAELAQSDAGLMRVELVDATSEGNRLDMSFPDRPKFMTLVELPDDSPYLTYVQYSTGEFHSYEKKNGEVYPPRTAPVTPATPAPFYIVGDSVAEAWTTNTADLTSATGRAVAVEGIGGQPSPPIAARQGGVPARVTVNGDSIPATGTVSVTAITEADGTALSPMHLTANGSRTREVIINGARCTLASTTASGVTTYTLTQVNGTTAMPCPAGTPMVPPARAAGTVTVILGPRNDLGPSVGDAFRQPLEKILARYKAMIDRAKLNGGRVILLPVVPRTDATTEGRANLVTLNNALRDLAPQDWADWIAWLKSDAAFAAAGVTKTADDATDITNGDTPRSFRSDTLHLNAAGYRAANRFISLVNSARGL